MESRLTPRPLHTNIAVKDSALFISGKKDGPNSGPYEISAGGAATRTYQASRQLTCERNQPPLAARLFWKLVVGRKNRHNLLSPRPICSRVTRGLGIVEFCLLKRNAGCRSETRARVRRPRWAVDCSYAPVGRV